MSRATGKCMNCGQEPWPGCAPEREPLPVDDVLRPIFYRIVESASRAFVDAWDDADRKRIAASIVTNGLALVAAERGSEREPLKEPSEAAIEADVSAPLCMKCEDEDIYDRSPESCRDCSRIRLRAAYAAERAPVAQPPEEG